MAVYPDEAVKKKIEGKVILSVVVDAKGNISELKALSGRPELVPAAIASVKMWTFEPPSHPPVTTTVEVGFGFPKDALVQYLTLAKSWGAGGCATRTASLSPSLKAMTTLGQHTPKRRGRRALQAKWSCQLLSTLRAA